MNSKVFNEEPVDNLVREQAQIADALPSQVGEFVDVQPTHPKYRTVGRFALRAATGVMIVAASPLTAVAAAEFGPSTHTTAAGLGASSHIEIGHDTSMIDLGVLGDIRLDRYKKILGVDIAVDTDIQGGQLDLDDSTVRSATGQILNHPDPEMDRIVRDTTKDTLEHMAIGGGAMLTFELVAGGVLIGRRRHYGKRGEYLLDDEQAQFNRKESRALAGVAAAIIIVPTLLGAHPVASPEHGAIVADPALADTGMHGAQLDGIVQNVAPTLISAMEPTEKFDELTAENALNLVAERPNLMPKEGWTYFLQADDLQDRSGMARQLGVLAKALNVNFIAMTGDWSTISQFGFGSYLMDTVRYESGGDIETWTDDGNHDTTETNQYARLAGFNVADNKTHNVDGVPMLFLNSVDVSTLSSDGLASVLRNPAVDFDKGVTNSTDEICTTQPMAVFAHDKNYIEAIINAVKQRGCNMPELFDTGRSFEQLGASALTGPDGKPSAMFVSGSSGGHYDTNIQFGNILVKSPINLFALNPSTREVKYATFTYKPDGTVSAPEDLSELVPPEGESVMSSSAARQTEQKVAGKTSLGDHE